MQNKHHSFIIEAQAKDGVDTALKWVESELGMKISGTYAGLYTGNPDISISQYGLFSVADARKVSELAEGVAFSGEHRVIIITASRIYHEAQNALLKVFEEPPKGVHIFLIVPTFGGILPTLRSRVQVLPLVSDEYENRKEGTQRPASDAGRCVPSLAREFVISNKKKRSDMIKKLINGKDEEHKRRQRDQAINLVNGIESMAYIALSSERRNKQIPSNITELLSDIATLRGYLYDRSAPMRMILEHLAIVTPEKLPSIR